MGERKVSSKFLDRLFEKVLIDPTLPLPQLLPTPQKEILKQDYSYNSLFDG